MVETGVEPTPGDGAAGDGALGVATVLIAEDNRLNMMLITTLIREIYPGMTILEAEDGIRTVELARTGRPDLILMDVQMPEIDGIEATRRIRSFEKRAADQGGDQAGNRIKRVPIVALTAGALKTEQEKCFSAGMDDFLPKPVERDKLSAVIDRFVLDRTDEPQAEARTGTPTDESEIVHFDRDALMARCNNDESLFTELVGAFLKTYPEKSEKIRSCLDDGNLRGVKKHAHALHGIALTVSLPFMARVAREMETFALPDEVDDKIALLGTKYDELESEWTIVQRIIQESATK